MGNAGGKWLLLFPLLLLLAPILHAQSAAPCPSCAMTDMYLEYIQEEARLGVVLSATKVDMSQERDIDQLREEYKDMLNERYNFSIPASDSKVEVYPVPDARMNISYELLSVSPEGRLTSAIVPLRCEGSADLGVIETDSNGAAFCRFDPSLFRGKCITIFVSYGGTPEFTPKEASLRLCDKERNAFSIMGATLASIGEASTSNPTCIAGMLILGLFVASMFFSGRSPLSLLDITTPLLPKPKSISYSGITFGVHYVRMRRDLQSMMRLSNKVLGDQAQGLRKELLRQGRTSAEIDSILALARDRPHMGYLALRALREGKTVKEARDIAKLNPSPANPKDLEKAGQVLKQMRAKGEDQALLALRSRIDAEIADKEVALVTGNVPKNLAKMVNAVFESKKSPLYYLMPENIRDQIRVGIGSMVMGTRSTAALTKAAAKEISKAVAKAAPEAPAAARRIPTILPARKKAEEKEAKDFYLMDIRSRISQLYSTISEEAKINAAMYLVKKMMEQKGGVKFELSEKEFLRLGDIDILKRMNLEKNPSLAQMEKKVLEILSKNIQMADKVKELMALAKAEGVRFDETGIKSFMSKVMEVERSTLSDSRKLAGLHQYLRDTYHVDEQGHDFRTVGTKGGDFYPWVGRNTLRYKSRDREYDDSWTFMFLRGLFEQNAQGRVAHMADSARILWVRLVNEMWGLFPSDPKMMPGVMGAKPKNVESGLYLQDMRATMARAEGYLADLLSKEGREALKKGGITLPDGRTIGIKSVYELLYNPAVHTLPMWSADELGREVGPDQRYWRLNSNDMRGFWRVHVPGSSILETATRAPVAKTSVMEQAFGEKYRSHLARPDSLDQTASRMFYNRLRNMVGSKYPDAYHSFNSEYRFLASTYGAYRERYAQMFGQSREKRSDYSWVTDEQVQQLIRSGISVDDIRKHVWVRTREGSYIPYTEGREGLGIRVSDGDRVINGKITYNSDGRWHSFDPMRIAERMRKQDVKLPEALEREQRQIMGMLGREDFVQEGLYKRKVISRELQQKMNQYFRDLSAWGGKQNQDAAAYYAYRLCKEAGDFSPLAGTKLLSIRPERDVDYVGFKKTRDKVLHPISRGIESSIMSAFLPQMKDLLDVTMNTEYLRHRTAEFSGRHAAAIANPGLDASFSSASNKDMLALVDAMTRYRGSWDFGITRDPRGNSSSIGPQLNFAAMHHHGPAIPYPPVAGLKEFQGRSFRKFMEGIRMMPMTVNWMLGAPFILQVRGALTNWYGYPSKHDKTYHPLNPYEMTASRTLEGVRSLFDPFYAALDFTSGSFRRIAATALSPFSPFINPSGMLSKHVLDPTADYLRTTSSTSTGFINRGGRAVGWVSDVLKAGTDMHVQDEFYLPHFMQRSAVREALTGPKSLMEYGGASMRDGVVRSHEDQAWIHKNINISWNVNTNPGVSYVDFNYNVHMDPRLAGHMVAGTRFRSYFSHDEYLNKQANLGTVQREVSPYELAEVREEELRHYQSPRQNRMLGLINPITFFINNPIWPLSWVTYESLVHRAPDKFRNLADRLGGEKPYADTNAPPKTFMMGRPVGNLEQTPYSTAQPVEGAPRTWAERWVRRAGQIASAVFAHTQYTSCLSCRSPVARGGACPTCSRQNSLPHAAGRKWAKYTPRGGTAS